MPVEQAVTLIERDVDALLQQLLHAPKQ
jgi:hypothetical protein